MLITRVQTPEGPLLQLSPEAAAILADYVRFMQDTWEASPLSPDAALNDALRMLVARYDEFRQWRQTSQKPFLFVPQPASRHSSRAPTSSPAIRCPLARKGRRL